MTQDSSPTVRLLDAAKGGDAAAREALYARYHQRVLTVVRIRMGALLRSRMESQDLVQSVMLESLRDLGRFEYRSEGSFLHWLSTLTERKIRDKVDYLKARKRDAGREIPTPEEPALPASRDRSPSRIVSQAEELLRLEASIRSLPPDQAELVVMTKLEGMDYAEIAAATGKTPEAVRKAAARALARLATAMAD